MQRLMTKGDVSAVLGLHPEYIMQLAREGRFPAPIKLDPRPNGAVRFDPDDVSRWIEERKAASQTAA